MVAQDGTQLGVTENKIITYIPGSISWCRAKQNHNDLLSWYRGPNCVYDQSVFVNIQHCAVNMPLPFSLKRRPAKLLVTKQFVLTGSTLKHLLFQLENQIRIKAHSGHLKVTLKNHRVTQVYEN